MESERPALSTLGMHLLHAFRQFHPNPRQGTTGYAPGNSRGLIFGAHTLLRHISHQGCLSAAAGRWHQPLAAALSCGSARAASAEKLGPKGSAEHQP